MAELTKQQKTKYVENYIISQGFTGNKKKLDEVFKFLYGFETVTAEGQNWESWEYRYKKLNCIAPFPTMPDGFLENYLYETAMNRGGYRLNWAETEWVLADAQSTPIG